MSNTILVGAQWGDEGKGKIIDILTEDTDVVVRTQGGNNAGHTVIIGGRKYVLHLLPSGILRRGKTCVIGNGVVIDPLSLLGEIDLLTSQGVKVGRNLMISEGAHVVFPYHRLLDELREVRKGRNRIGTTKRGIGPAYGDKVERTGLRMCDLVDPESFAPKLRRRVAEMNAVLKAMGGRPVSCKTILTQYTTAARRLAPFVCNTVVFLHDAIRRGRRLLFEGAQGTYLDIDHGTYPFVTSSNTTAGGACTGSGVPPHRINRVVGVMKAYTTRVGEGPFPTENPEIADLLHEMGREFGATTGRPRRCGWFDAVATRYAAMINGIDELAITNLDGLDTLEQIKVCVAYRCAGTTLTVPPTAVRQWEVCEPVYKVFPGWRTPTGTARRWRELPPNARAYLETIADLTGARLRIVSVGPERAQTIVL